MPSSPAKAISIARVEALRDERSVFMAPLAKLPNAFADSGFSDA
jgi:hypothetical protein